MKTKIKLLLVGVLSLATIITSSVAVADQGAYNDGQTCEGKPCKQFHEDGINFNGPLGTGLSFPSFNNYVDYPTADGRQFDERQFVYIEKARAQYAGMPYPAPWDNYPAFQFNQSDIEHELYFTGNPNEKKRFGLWIYMHNNAIGGRNEYTADDVRINIDRWASSQPQLEFHPRATIGSSNTKPSRIWADVEITSNDTPFTLTPVEGYLSKIGPQYITLASGDLTLLTHDGVTISSGSSTAGEFRPSQDYYVVFYLEFEATSYPEDKGECRNLNITTPNGGANNEIVVTEPLDNLPLSISLDSDEDIVDQFQYRTLPTDRGLLLKETQNSSGTRNLFADNTNNSTDTIYIDGLPRDGQPGDSQTVRVFALDDDQNALDLCDNQISFIYSPDDKEEPECADLTTTPGSTSQPVALNANTTITLNGPTNTEGNPFTINGQNPLIQYCFSNTDIAFSPSIWQTSPQCAQAPSNIELTVTPTSPGTMNIDVLGTDVEACTDSFVTEENQYGGECLSLDFTPDDIRFNGIDDYCVDLVADPIVYTNGYNNEIEWSINNGEHTFTTSGSNTCIEPEDFPNDYTWAPGDTLTANALIEGDCDDVIDSEDIPCTELELDKDKFTRNETNEICIESTDWPVEETGLLVEVDGERHEIDGDDIDNDCFNLRGSWLDDNAEEVEIWVKGYRSACGWDLDVDDEKKPPEFEKNVRSGARSFSSRAAINYRTGNVDYEITYEHINTEPQDVTITDTIGREGEIQGYIASSIDDIDSQTPLGGTIEYGDEMEITVDGDRIKNCDDTTNDLCYRGDIGNPNGVEIRNVPSREEVRITYLGDVRTKVSAEACTGDNDLTKEGVCGEIYPNRAEFDDDAGYDERDRNEDDEAYDNEAVVIIPCPYIIVRSGGEVFLENPFEYGVDTLSCSEIPNVPVPIITPDEDNPDLVSTGSGDSLLTAFTDKSLCKEEDQDIEGYGDIKNISSLICEFTLKTSDDLTQYGIVQNIARNINLFARYGENLSDAPIDGSDNLPNVSSKVYLRKGNLTLGGEFSNGAQTIVVMGGNLKINKNITFKDPTNLTDPRQIPSLAIIVIGGNIEIADGVTETNGVIFVQEDENGKGGRICQGPCDKDDQYSNNPLVHYGSIYGDIEHLFKHRTYSGDVTKDEAAILIRFDNRIYLNTPPILGELVNITSEVF